MYKIARYFIRLSTDTDTDTEILITDDSVVVAVVLYIHTTYCFRFKSLYEFFHMSTHMTMMKTCI